MQYLDIDNLRRCRQTLAASLSMFRRAEAGSLDQEVFRNAIIKGYELAQETAFKLLIKALKTYGHGGRKLMAMSVKELLRLSATHGLMSLEEVERWFAYRDNRNSTAHDYGERFALETLELLDVFLLDLDRLTDVLERQPGEWETTEGGAVDR